MQVVLNIGSRDIRLVAAREDKVLKWQSVSIQPGLVKHGHITQPQEVARVIDSLFLDLKLPRNNVSACIEGLSFTYRTLSLPRLASPLMGEAVERAARKEIPLPLEELYLEWVTTGESKEEVNVFIAGAPRSHIDVLVDTFRMARINLTAIGLKPLALARAAGKSNALIVDFEADCFEITVVSGGVPAIMHTVTPKSESSSLEDKITQLVDELNRTINFHNITHPEKPVAPDTSLLLSGSLALEEPVAERMSQGTGYPVAPFTARLPLPADLPVTLYAANFGLILKRKVRKTPTGRDADAFYDIDIDLFNARRRILARPMSRRNLLLPAVLLIFALLLIPLYSGRNNAIAGTARLQAEMDRLSRNLRLARTQNDAAIQAEAGIQKLMVETGSLKKGYELVAGRKDDAAIIQFIAVMASGLAEYSSINIGPDGITVEGKVASRPAVIQYVRLLEKYSKFSAVRIALIEEEGNTGTGTDTDKSGSASGKEGAGKGVSFRVVIEQQLD